MGPRFESSFTPRLLSLSHSRQQAYRCLPGRAENMYGRCMTAPQENAEDIIAENKLR